MRTRVVFLLMFLGACGQAPEPPLVASDVIVTRPVPGTKMSAAYMSLTNNSTNVIRITRVLSRQYESVALHESSIEDGVARMRSMPALEIAPGETVTLKPGGRHLMLMRPSGAFDAVSLDFLSGDDLVLTVDAGFDRKPD